VRLVLNSRQQAQESQRLRVLRLGLLPQFDGPAIRQNQAARPMLLILYHASDRQRQPEFSQHRPRSLHLRAAAIEQYQGRAGCRTVHRRDGETAQHFTDSRAVVRSGEGSDFKMPILLAGGPAIQKDHQAGCHVGTSRMRDVNRFDAADARRRPGQLGQFADRFLQSRLAVTAQHRVAAQGQLRILGRERYQSTSVAALRHVQLAAALRSAASQGLQTSCSGTAAAGKFPANHCRRHSSAAAGKR
jgi:hypothetical protein